MEFQQVELMSLSVHVKFWWCCQNHEPWDYPNQQKTVMTGVSGRLPQERIPLGKEKVGGWAFSLEPVMSEKVG